MNFKVFLGCRRSGRMCRENLLFLFVCIGSLLSLVYVYIFLVIRDFIYSSFTFIRFVDEF